MQLLDEPERSRILMEHSAKNIAVLKENSISLAWLFSTFIVDELHQGTCNPYCNCSQHWYKVNRCWISCFTGGGITAQGQVFKLTACSTELKQEVAQKEDAWAVVFGSYFPGVDFGGELCGASFEGPTHGDGWDDLSWPQANHCLGLRCYCYGCGSGQMQERTPGSHRKESWKDFVCTP